MKLPSFLAPALACLLFLPGCAAISHHDDSKQDSYTDHASGVVLPKSVGSLERVSLDDDDPDKTPVTAHYAPAGSSDYLDAAIRILPATQAEPEQLISETIRSVETRPNFAQNDYRGNQSFGASRAFCAECSFDRPESGDRATFKIAIIPRGNYLLCFTFLVRSAQEQATQSVVDAFIQEILARTNKKQVYLTPSKPPDDDAGGN